MRIVDFQVKVALVCLTLLLPALVVVVRVELDLV